MKPEALRKGLQRRRDSFHYAFNGVRTVFSTQVNARIHFVAGLGVVGAAVFFGISLVEWCVLLLAIALVWVSEAINTAVEFAVDLASPGHHVLAGKAKDVAAGAVMLAACFAAVIGCILFIPKVLVLL